MSAETEIEGAAGDSPAARGTGGGAAGGNTGGNTGGNSGGVLALLARLEEGLIAVILLGLALMAFVQVVTRACFGLSFTWFEELSRYLGVFVTFLGASLGVKYGMHFSMDAVIRVIPARPAHLIQGAANLAAGLFFLALIYYSWLNIAKLRRFGVTTAALGVPMYWAYLPIPVFSVTIAWRFFRVAGREFLAGFRGDDSVAAESKRPGGGEKR